MAVKAGEYPELRLKAWTSRVLTAFLAVCVHDLAQKTPVAERDAEVVLAAAVLARLAHWMLIIEKCPRLMSDQQVAEVDRACWELLAQK